MRPVNLPSFTKPRFRDTARIIWALFSKDVLEALKNKATVTILFTSLLIVFFYRALPGLSTQGEAVHLLIAAPENSDLVLRLEDSLKFKVYTYPSEQKMKQVLADGESPELGLVIPDGFEQAIQAGETPELQGYVLRWVSQKDANSLQQAAETEIGALLGRQVKINLDGNRVDLLPESDGLGAQAGMGLAFVLIVIGVVLVPHLMLEEKQNRTLDALTVSPASPGLIVVGKALVGLFYCSIGGVIALALNHILVVHWWLALLAVLLGSLFVVSLGLWFGIKIDSRTQLSLWAWVILLSLIMPLIFTLLQGLLPDALVGISKIVPSSVIFNLVRISFANPIPVGNTLLLLAWMAVASGLVLAIVAWMLGRRDREMEAFSSNWRQSLATAVEGGPGLFTPMLERISQLRAPQRVAGLQSPSAGERELQAPRARSGLAMICIIAAKDLLEALKNRLFLSILLGSTFILLSGAALPFLLSANLPPRVVVYDQGRSGILRTLSSLKNLQVISENSLEEMKLVLVSSKGLALGLILPANTDQLIADKQMIELPAYFPHWANPDQLAQRAAFLEQQFNQASGGTIKLDLTGHAIYPSVDQNGQPMMLLNLIAVILVIGIALVPLLVIEEKETQTLRALLVSPASLGQVIIGKGLVGLFYSLIPALVILLFYHHLFVHWDVAILAILLTALLAVVAGLLLGVLADSPTTASMWCSLVLLVLIGSALVKLFTGAHLPPAVQSVLDWLPGSAMLRLFNISQAGEIPIGYLWTDVSALLAVIAAISVVLAWRVQRMEG